MTERDKQELLHALFTAHYHALVAAAYRLCSNRELAEDIVQNTFVVAQVRIDVLAAVDNQRAWLYKVMQNVIGDVYRRQKAMERLRKRLAQQARGSYEDELDLQTLYEGALRDEDLQLLVWLYCDRRSYAEIAEELGISLDACKKRIQRAKERLRKVLDDENT